MRHSISPITSVVLDVTRVSLALAVAIGHWTQHTFQDGWPELTRPAVVAVGGFFVLSGYTIRLLTPSDQPFSARSFFVERLSRLWSVALPAIALTLMLDGLSYLINPDFYSTHWGAQATHPAARVLITLIFGNELWGHDVSLLSNSLFWSLSYEAGFYFLYGVYRSTRGVGRIVSMTLAALLVGPNILIMLGPWLCGVWLFDLDSRIRLETRRSTFMWLSLGGGLVVALGLSLLQVERLSSLLTNTLLHAFAWADRHAGHELVGVQFGLGRLHGDLIIGAAALWLLFLFGLPLARVAGTRLTPSRRIVDFARRLGAATFPLYLLHFPVFVLLGSLGLHDRGSALQKGLLLTGVCVVILLLSPLAEPIKRWLRARLTSLTSRVTRARAPVVD